MKLTSNLSGGKLTMSLSGELDQHAAKELAVKMEERLEADLPRECVLDLGALRFMDSSGIALILRVCKRMRALGGRTRVENVQPQPMRVIDASGIGRIIEID